MAGKQAMNGRYDLDLTELVEPISLKIGEYTCTLSPDISMPALVRISRAFQQMGGALTDEEDIDFSKLGISEGEMWALTEEILAKAVPPPDIPAHELLTTMAAVKLLTFLVQRFNTAVGAASS